MFMYMFSCFLEDFFLNLILSFKCSASALLGEGELRALMVPPCESEVEAVYGTS